MGTVKNLKTNVERIQMFVDQLQRAVSMDSEGYDLRLMRGSITLIRRELAALEWDTPGGGYTGAVIRSERLRHDRGGS